MYCSQIFLQLINLPSTLENSSCKQLGCITSKGNDSSELHCQWKQTYNKHTPQPDAGEFPPGDNHLENKKFKKVKCSASNEFCIIGWSNSSQIGPNMEDKGSQSMKHFTSSRKKLKKNIANQTTWKKIYIYLSLKKKVKNIKITLCLEVTEDHLWHH